MEFGELIQKRYSVRKFSSKPVEIETILKILEAGNLAPTAVNTQPQRIMVVKSPEGLKKLEKSNPCQYNCTVAFVIFYDKRNEWKRAFDMQGSGYVDASIVGTHMMLQIADLGMGSTWVMHFDPFILKQEFQIADALEPVAILVAGWPAKTAKPAKMHWDRKDVFETSWMV